MDSIPEPLEVQGSALTLWLNKRIDAKRYINLFKTHVEKKHSSFKVRTVGKCINIVELAAGSDVVVGSFVYSVGMVKAVYMHYVAKGYSITYLVDALKKNELNAFPDSEYNYPTNKPLESRTHLTSLPSSIIKV